MAVVIMIVLCSMRWTDFIERVFVHTKPRTTKKDGREITQTMVRIHLNRLLKKLVDLRFMAIQVSNVGHYVCVFFQNFSVVHFFLSDGIHLRGSDMPGQARVGVMTEVICKINMNRNGFADCIKYVQLGEDAPRAWVVLGDDLARRNAFTCNLNEGVPSAFFQHTLLYSSQYRDAFQNEWQPKGKRWHRIFFAEKCVGCDTMYTTEVTRNGKTTGSGSKKWVYKNFELRPKQLYGGIYCSFCYHQWKDTNMCM